MFESSFPCSQALRSLARKLFEKFVLVLDFQSSLQVSMTAFFSNPLFRSGFFRWASYLAQIVFSGVGIHIGWMAFFSFVVGISDGVLFPFVGPGLGNCFWHYDIPIL